MTELSNKEVELQGFLQFKDFLDYNMFHNRKRWAISTVSIFILELIFLLYSNLFTFTGTMILSIILGIIFGGLFYIIFYRNMKRAYKADSLIRLQMNIIIKSQGIQLKTERSNALYLWDDIKKATHYKKLYLLYVSNIKAIVIPDRFFQSEDSLKDFKFLVNKHLKITSNIKMTISEEMKFFNKDE